MHRGYDYKWEMAESGNERDPEAESCMELWAAVVQQALEDLKDKNAIISWGAKNWFLSDSTEEASFLWICENIGLEPSFFIRMAHGKVPSESKLRGPSSLGERLRLYRQESGMKQREIAKRINVSQATLSSLETGAFRSCRSVEAIEEYLAKEGYPA